MAGENFAGNIERFSGFASRYNGHRPQPPGILAELLTQMGGIAYPSLVVDLGCGTGLSTRYWKGRAAQVIGIEPSDSMREEAENFPDENIRFQKGFSHDTQLPEACAQVVTCSQSLHWMDPLPTFAEAARILQKGGVFAAYDYDWPPCTGCWEVDAAYDLCMREGRALEKKHGLDQRLKQWDKPGHVGRMRESGAFRDVREVCIHHRDQGNANRLVQLILSQGYMNSLLKMGLNEQDLGIDRLRQISEERLGNGMKTWLWSSRVRIGIV